MITLGMVRNSHHKVYAAILMCIGLVTSSFTLACIIWGCTQLAKKDLPFLLCIEMSSIVAGVDTVWSLVSIKMHNHKLEREKI